MIIAQVQCIHVKNYFSICDYIFSTFIIPPETPSSSLEEGGLQIFGGVFGEILETIVGLLREVLGDLNIFKGLTGGPGSLITDLIGLLNVLVAKPEAGMDPVDGKLISKTPENLAVDHSSTYSMIHGPIV